MTKAELFDMRTDRAAYTRTLETDRLKTSVKTETET